MFDDNLTLPKIRKFIDAHYWTFAKTMPWMPHEYILKTEDNEKQFLEIAIFIRKYGYLKPFGKNQVYAYFDVDEYCYWTINEASLIEMAKILNRARLK